MAMMATIETNYFVQEKLGHSAIIEIIHPMTRDYMSLVEAI